MLDGVHTKSACVQSARLYPALMGLNMLVETAHGFDYTGADCAAWMKEAGFRETRVERLIGPDSMVMASSNGIIARKIGRLFSIVSVAARLFPRSSHTPEFWQDALQIFRHRLNTLSF